MQSKRDQVQAHMFLMGRLTSSMLRADPDAPESPQGRTNRGVAIGVLIALVVSAGAFVVGLISPGTKDSWRSSGTLIVDRDTGSRYLYLDGRLRPVRNYASARLLAGDRLETTTVRTSSLSGTPHGAPVGIPGAPDSLPGAKKLSTDAWQVCSGAPSTTGRPTTALAVGEAADGGALRANEGLLVAGPDGNEYLVWRGSRLRLDRDRGAPEALGYGSTSPLHVTAAFLDALPAGPDLAPPDTEDAGEAGPSLGGHRTKVGQVFSVTAPGSGARYHLLRSDGLVPLTATGAALVLGDPRTKQRAYGGGEVTVAELGADALKGHLAPRTEQAPAALPEAPPRAVVPGPRETACVQVRPGVSQGPEVSLSLVTADSLGPAAQPPAEGLTPACVPVDRITVPPGGGALVHALGAGGTEVGDTVYLVTDTGMKYRIRTQEALESLGYAGATPRRLPSLLLSMLPTGPDLDAETARRGRAATTRLRCAPVPEGKGATRD